MDGHTQRHDEEEKPTQTSSLLRIQNETKQSLSRLISSHTSKTPNAETTQRKNVGSRMKAGEKNQSLTTTKHKPVHDTRPGKQKQKTPEKKKKKEKEQTDDRFTASIASATSAATESTSTSILHR
jgi:hypothetical protein